MTKVTVESDRSMVIIPLEEWETMKEAIEVLSNRALMRDLDQALQDHKDGKSLDFDEFWEKEMNEA